MRRGLKGSLTFSGTGLHSGQATGLTLEPAPPGSGYSVAFGEQIFPLAQAVRQGDGRGTRLNFDGQELMTVEHVLSALRGLEVDDVILRPSGVEVPLLDGSAAPFVRVLEDQIRETEGEPDWLSLSTPLAVSSADGTKTVAALPWDGFAITYVIDYPGTPIGTQMITVDLTARTFSSLLADCRTFCLEREVQEMRRLGLAKGGGLHNAVVWGDRGPLNPEGLRRDDEAVRHKALDLVGDLALTGCKLRGHFVALRAGHALHLQMVDALLRACRRF